MKNVSSKNVWDALSGRFNTNNNASSIDPKAADNILLAWPPMVECIQRRYPVKKLKKWRVLDFGCGTGGFAKKLSLLGYEVVGMDCSQEMIRQASQTSDPAIRLVVGDANTAEKEGSFDILTGVMVFQFIENIEEALTSLNKVIRQDGMVVMAVFNPSYVRACVERQYWFQGFENDMCLGEGIADFGGGNTAPVFIRNVSEYDALMASFSFRKALEIYPPFTEAFVERYGVIGTRDISEFMILGYTR